MRRATGDARDGRSGVLRAAAGSRDTARSRTADRDRRSAAGRRRAGARAAATGGYERGRCRSGARATANAAARCRSACRANRTGSRATSMCAKTGSCSTARRPGTSERSCIACERPTPASSRCRRRLPRDVQPHHRGAEPGREAGDRQAVTEQRRRFSSRIAARARCCDAGRTPRSHSVSRCRPACGRPTASCCA